MMQTRTTKYYVAVLKDGRDNEYTWESPSEGKNSFEEIEQHLQRLHREHPSWHMQLRRKMTVTNDDLLWEVLPEERKEK